MTRWRFWLPVMAALLGACRPAPRPSPQACRISAGRSSLAWQYLPGAGGLHGLVLSAGSAAPIRGAAVQVEPGGLRIPTDSGGRFRLSLPRGVYAVRVRALGYEEVRDSIALPGLDGYEVVAVLAHPTVGLIGCTT